MQISKLTQVVDEKLNKMSVKEKLFLFKELFQYPLDFKDEIYYYGHHEWDELKMSDFLSISQNWLTIPEYEKLYDFLNEKEKLG
jgi:hypothetical protein